MIPYNRLSPRKLMAVSLVGALVYVGGCTVAPKSAAKRQRLRLIAVPTALMMKVLVATSITLEYFLSC